MEARQGERPQRSPPRRAHSPRRRDPAPSPLQSAPARPEPCGARARLTTRAAAPRPRSAAGAGRRVAPPGACVPRAARARQRAAPHQLQPQRGGPGRIAPSVAANRCAPAEPPAGPAPTSAAAWTSSRTRRCCNTPPGLTALGPRDRALAPRRPAAPRPHGARASPRGPLRTPTPSDSYCTATPGAVLRRAAPGPRDYAERGSVPFTTPPGPTQFFYTEEPEGHPGGFMASPGPQPFGGYYPRPFLPEEPPGPSQKAGAATTPGSSHLPVQEPPSRSYYGRPPAPTARPAARVMPPREPRARPAARAFYTEDFGRYRNPKP